MRNLHLTALAALVALAALAPSVAAAQDKIIPVEVSHTGKDPVGQNIVSHLKEKIRATRRLKLVQGVDAPRMKMVLTSVTSGDSRDPEASSALATAFVYDDPTVPIDGALILTHVYDCGRDRAESCAQRLLSILDRQISYLQEKWPNLYKKL